MLIAENILIKLKVFVALLSDKIHRGLTKVSANCLYPSKGKNAIYSTQGIMHYLLSKFNITRHDGVKCNKLNVDQPVFRKQLMTLQTIIVI